MRYGLLEINSHFTKTVRTCVGMVTGPVWGLVVRGILYVWFVVARLLTGAEPVAGAVHANLV